MALVVSDRVRDSSTTTGTGTITLSGTAPTGYQNFSVIGNGNQTYYTITGGSQWEVGIGTYTSSGTTLSRTTVLSSSNSNALVNFGAGTKDVFCDFPAGLGADVNNYNALINPDFNIWQRGTSFVGVTIPSSAFYADRWRGGGNTTTAVHTISQSTDVPTVAQAGRLFNYSMLADCTTADASIAAGDFVTLVQPVEGFNFLPLAQREMTLSFWVKATKTGIYCVSFRNSGTNRSYVAEYTVNTTATWEFKTITIPASPSAGTWNYTTGVGLFVGWTLAAGTTYQTTANAWQTGNFGATVNQVNACDSTSNDFRITGAKLEPGSVATMSQPKIFSDGLAECQRYCFIPANAANQSICGGYSNATTSVRAVIPFPVEMRTAPSLAVTTPGRVYFQSTANYTASAVAGILTSAKSSLFELTISGATAGQGGTILTQTGDPGIIFSAEL